MEKLATASADDVNRLWSGLGYYRSKAQIHLFFLCFIINYFLRRGQQLLLGAQKVVTSFGEVPRDKTSLLSVPGIGPYTAGAILSIAFNQAEPVVDGNVIRVLSRLYAIDPAKLSVIDSSYIDEGNSDESDNDLKQNSKTGTNGKPNEESKSMKFTNKALEKICWTIAGKLVDPVEPGDFNQALMELGATVCKPTSPSCSTCPLRSICRADKLVQVSSYLSQQSIPALPVASSSKKAKIQTTLSTFIVSKTSSSPSSSSSSQESKKENQFKLSPTVIENCHLLPLQVTYFPVKQAKKAPKEVDVSVCVLATTSHSSERKFLFLRRPPSGLLANQWEFPSIINNPTTSTSANNIPIDRRTLFQSFFQSKTGILLLWKEINEGKRERRIGIDTEIKVLKEIHCVEPSILHIFSHERHNMLINILEVEEPKSSSYEMDSKDLKRLETLVTYSWMTAGEIRTAGITTGCKKILNAVEKSFDTNSSHSKSSKKRQIKSN